MKQSISAMISSRKLFFQTTSFLLITIFFLWLFFENTTGSGSSDVSHPFWLNVFFINYTFMGNGLFIMSLALVLIYRYKRKKQGMAMICCFLFSGLLIQLIKNISNLSHPDIFFEPLQMLFSFNNITTDGSVTFISGHTTMAFALATVLILTSGNPKWQLPLLAAAALLGFSRIYLAQAFLPQILIGALVGTILGIAAVYVVYYFKGHEFYFRKFFKIHQRDIVSGETNIQPV